ncbi:DNA/RNA non-specific endonuclease [Marinomonas sp. 2405UD68-3]|uniref:DNA/RNA non-specific endonuclease n=1 Tax=Marinomonas sp. 2405UD68-3 TaxID=3391835 RepID=UPI0039C9630A
MKRILTGVVVVASIASSFAFSQSNTIPKNLSQYDFENYSVLLTCSDRAPNISNECQPKRLGTYKGKHGPEQVSFDRSHLIDANTFDFSATAIKQSNYMVNIAPQISYLNRDYAWKEIEERLDCYRTPEYISQDKSILVMAGVIWGNNESDDYFIDSHGVKTPDAFFKIVSFNGGPQGNKVYAWKIPNVSGSQSDNPDDFLVSVQSLVIDSGVFEIRDLVPVVDYTVSETSMPRPSVCDLS